MKKAVTGSAIMALIAASSALGAIAKPLAFAVGDTKQRDVVSFTSDAPIELIVGKTSNISGQVTIDDSLDLSKKPIEATFDVDLASIDTGIPLRNEHMRENFLETGTYPKATFKLKTLAAPVVLKPGQKAKLNAVGDFTVHGKTVTKTVPVTVTYFRKCPMTEQKMTGCDLLQMNAQFPVAFKDHGIKRPEIVFQKLADTVIVTVAATGFTKAAAADTTKKAALPKTK